MINSMQLKNFLSFGECSPVIQLGNLNVLIGPNGSGKSNLFEAISLLKATPTDLAQIFREGGSVSEWLWKGDGKSAKSATISITIDPQKAGIDKAKHDINYSVSFTASNSRLEIIDEKIEYSHADAGETRPYFFYKYDNNNPVINLKLKQDDTVSNYSQRKLERAEIDPEKSILAQRYDPASYPELAKITDLFKNIQLYRNWSFGPMSAIRKPQRTDLPNSFLLEDASNLALVLNQLKMKPTARQKLFEAFTSIYAGLDDFDVLVEGNTIQVYLRERGTHIFASRLSDGTLRFLSMLTILYNPIPSPIICIEEPELGLHPDMIHIIAEALLHASQHTQIFVTTHSVGLVDALTTNYKSIIVCEKNGFSTELKHLEDHQLEPWLEKFSLGELWTSGELGGNRW